MFTFARRGTLVLLIALSMSLGCGEPAQVRVVAGPRFGNEVIAVAPFDVAGTEVVSYDLPYTELGRELATDIAEELRQRGHESRVLAPDAPEADGAVVRGRILRINGGSFGLRFWIGMGAGRAQVTVDGTVAQADGTNVASFRLQRSSSGEAQLGFANDHFLVQKCRRVLAADIAEMIDSGQYKQQ